MQTDFQLVFSELALDTPAARAALQRNEDKIEEFNKWSENMVRFVQSILEEAERMSQLLPSLEVQIGKFSNFQSAFGVDRTVEALEIIGNLLRNTQNSNHRLVGNIAERILTPLQAYFQQDFRALRESRKVFERASDRYETAISRFHSLSKFKDVLELDGELVKLYEQRVGFFNQTLDHAGKINDFKQVIDLLFLEKIALLIDELSEFFKTLSDNFLSVKQQMDQVRGEFDRLSGESQEKRRLLIQERNEVMEKIKNRWDPTAPIAHQLSAQKQGQLYLRRRKALGNPWKRVYATITDGHFNYETGGRSRGSIETGEEVNLMLCEIRPVELNERRFCFEIYSANGQNAIVLQAESENEMMDWINTFHTAKSELLERRKQADQASSITEVKDEVVTEEPEFNYGNHLILKKWNEDLRRHFEEISLEEVVLCSFPASLHTDIWTQGRVFVSQYAIYFFSSLFGIGKKIIIPLRDVMKVDVVQSSFVTLINLDMSGDAKDFTLKTFNAVDDSTEKFIDQLLLLHRNTQSVEPKNARLLFNELQEYLPTSEEPNKDTTVEEQQATNEPSPTTSSSSSSSSELISSAAPIEGVKATTLPSDQQNKEIPCGCSSHMDKRQVNTVIPIDCAVAFDLMFGSQCPVQHAVQEKRKNRNYKITDWTTNAEGLQERKESFMFPLNNPLVRMKETECYVTIKLSKNEPGRCYVVDCQTSTPNIPYADSFYTKTRYCITRAGSDQTRISISLGIVWLKSPFVKSIIKSTTLKTFTDFCVDYMTCLRAEIAKKITPGGDASKKIEEIAEEALDSSTLNEPAEESEKIHANDSLLTPFSASMSVLGVVLMLLTCLISYYAGMKRSSTGAVITSRDLELEIQSSLGILGNSANLKQQQWTSIHFSRSHARLQSLHHEFDDLRASLLHSLRRINDLERRIYHAQSVTLLGDRLLSCQQGKSGIEDCKSLEQQWRQLIQ